MKRLLIGLTIGIATFLIGLMPWVLTRDGGLSDCMIAWDSRDEPEIPHLVLHPLDETKDVYDVILADELLGRSYLVVSETTTPGDWLAGIDPDKQMSGLEKETFDGYRGANSQINYLGALLGNRPP